MAVELTCSFEAFEPKAYQMTINGKLDVPTIGYGTIKYPNGIYVKMGDSCTEEQALSWVNDHMKKFIYPIVEKLQNKYQFSDKVFASLCSLGYNIGSALSGESIINALSQKNLNMLSVAFNKYNKFNGQPSKGLTNRRQKEVEYFMQSHNS